jgi:hypothetical protein
VFLPLTEREARLYRLLAPYQGVTRDGFGPSRTQLLRRRLERR